jgi:uncharacterized Tic20 family protein
MNEESKDWVEEVNGEAGASPAPAEVEGAAEVEVEPITLAEAESAAVTGIEDVAEQPLRAAEQPASRSVETAPAAGIGPAPSERTWAALAHASVLLTFVLGVSTGGLAVLLAVLVPLAIWLAFRDRSRFVAFHAMQATVFQAAVLLAWIGLLVVGLVILIPAWIVTILLLVILVGLLLLPLTLVLTILVPGVLAALPFAGLVYGLYAAFEVYAGRAFRYWRVADWVERRGMKPA